MISRISRWRSGAGERDLLVLDHQLELVLDGLMEFSLADGGVGNPGAQPLEERLAGPFLERVEGLAGNGGGLLDLDDVDP